MASSRLEKVGTIFTRVTGLLRSGAMKEEDKPIWYDVYKAFPPVSEPRFDRPAPKIPIKNIFYPEDVIRAKFHKLHADSVGTVDLKDRSTETAAQKLIGLYGKMDQDDSLPEEKGFEVAVKQLKEDRALSAQKAELRDLEPRKSLVSSFQEAQKKGNSNIDIKEIFKE